MTGGIARMMREAEFLGCAHIDNQGACFQVFGNILTRGQWRSEGAFTRRLGQLQVRFLSGDRSASVTGATASLLLIVNEAQDISPDVYRRKFEPMAASTNATRIFAGTAWTSRNSAASWSAPAAAHPLHEHTHRNCQLMAKIVSRLTAEVLQTVSTAHDCVSSERATCCAPIIVSAITSSSWICGNPLQCSFIRASRALSSSSLLFSSSIDCSSQGLLSFRPWRLCHNLKCQPICRVFASQSEAISS